MAFRSPPAAPRRARAVRRALGAWVLVPVGAAAAAAPRAAAQGPPPAAAARPRAAEPDVRFMRQMLPHHAQALAMAALVPGRSSRADVRAVAERIAASQGDEMALMRRWLAARGVDAADSAHAAAAHEEHAAHAGAGHAADGGASGAAPGTAAMPGMLTPAELTRLRALRGPAFDRAFLAAMIRHHEGALAMVAALLAAPGGAQDAEAFRLASDVDADQRAEVRRMRALLAAAPPRRR